MNYRIFVEKKEKFNFQTTRLKAELIETFNFKNLNDLRLINIYDIFNIEKSELEKAKKLVFSEIVTDNIFDNIDLKNKKYFAYEYLPGQFDQRADSAIQCLNLISNENQEVKITTGKLIILNKEMTDKEIDKIKNYMINKVEAREKDLTKLQLEDLNVSKKIEILKDFRTLNKIELKKFLEEYALAMTLEDLEFIQEYFKDTEKRDPTETEIKVLDTYWSDHCRHTTFETKLKNIIFPKDNFSNILQKTFNDYLEMRNIVYNEKAKSKKISLMDMATISGKYLRKIGKLNDLEISDEINACSVYIDVDVNGEIEKWLLMFKNETHNHPTEIEPFGGAATCLGGAIRDPLSGRSYVYQAIRITGAGNPLKKIKDTLPGKLPQKKITLEASNGYSSYGNQIGLATSFVNEIYHDGYKAKRMEVGAVVGAVPANWVRREQPLKGDIVILLGGKTGRDGIGGATGSSKKHTSNSLTMCGAEVQKGNAPEERKIQRFFRNKDVTKLIKKCNDFGAGGVSVAIGELADGIEINLDKVPTKYTGLSGTEVAISESQERMAVLINKKDMDKFIELANKENLEATHVATVTDDNRITMNWHNKKIVDIDRIFLNTNGKTGETNVKLQPIHLQNNPFTKNNLNNKNIKEQWENMISSLNVASQKGLMEKFDSSIGAGTVLMPFGGKYQMTPTELSIHKIPVITGKTNTASAISFGYNPQISTWSEYHGGIYAVIESISKFVAAGGDYKKLRLSFQEYFEKLGKDPEKWGKPFLSLLGTINAQKEFEIPAIGGKDSMSGTFNNIHVPSTLISFAVGTLDARNVISPEFKKVNNKVYIIKNDMDENFLPNMEQLKENFKFIHKNIKNKNIISSMTLKHGGIAEALTKMSFGNRIGIDLRDMNDKIKNNLFNLNYGSIIVETDKELPETKNIIYLGTTIDDYKIILNNEKIDLHHLEKIWLDKLNPVFPYKTDEEHIIYNLKIYKDENNTTSKNKVKNPKVLIPVFPGTNCEYDSYRAFKEAGGEPKIIVFKNNNQEDIKNSIKEFSNELKTTSILMLSGGFSAGDEPDGSGKFIANILKNEEIEREIKNLLSRDGLILGICNGFQALIKSGLLPYGDTKKLNENSPTLTFNKIGRHISQMVQTKIISNKSPWLKGLSFNKIYTIPVSHGEGRFIADDKVIKELFENGQIATCYVNFDGMPTNEFRFNPNGSNFAIEGITSKDGHIFGKMGHAERYGENIYKNIIGEDMRLLFKNGVEWCKGLK